MARKPIKINRNTSPQRRLRDSRKTCGVMGLYPSMRRFELFWIPIILAVLLALYIFFCACSFVLNPMHSMDTAKLWLMLVFGILLALGDIAAFIFLWKCPFCGCKIKLSHTGAGLACNVCRKKLWGRFKGRKM